MATMDDYVKLADINIKTSRTNLSLLGVDLENELKFDDHISIISRKVRSVDVH